MLSRPLYKGYGNGGVLTPLTGTVFIVWFYKMLGATIGRDVCLYPGGKTGLMTEPDLVEVCSLSVLSFFSLLTVALLAR